MRAMIELFLSCKDFADRLNVVLNIAHNCIDSGDSLQMSSSPQALSSLKLRHMVTVVSS